MDIDLSCAGCPTVRPQPLPDWAGAAGHAGCIGWLETDARPGGPARLLQVPPAPGSTCSLLVRHPFKGRIGQSQWLLFEPAAPWREGWAQHARRLHQLAIIKAEPLRFIGTSSARAGAEQQTGWLTVRVEELVLAPDLPRRFEPVRWGPLGSPALLSPWSPTETAVVERGNLVLYERSISAEIGMWALCLRSSLAPPTLLVLCEWGFHEAGCLAGHRPLSEEEGAMLEAARG